MMRQMRAIVNNAYGKIYCIDKAGQKINQKNIPHPRAPGAVEQQQIHTEHICINAESRQLQAV